MNTNVVLELLDVENCLLVYMIYQLEGDDISNVTACSAASYFMEKICKICCRYTIDYISTIKINGDILKELGGEVYRKS